MPPDLIHFIKDVLGCTCPDEVLADIQVVPDPDGFAGLPVDFLLRVGGRLLVGVCLTPMAFETAEILAACVSSGKSLRDSWGFNRFRLVVAFTDPGARASGLERWFKALPGIDERSHFHVVARDQVHGLLTS